MKNIGVFYLIFVVMLSAFPCSDELEDDGFTQNVIVNAAHGIEKGQMENCSPICACTCCGQNLIKIDVVSIIIKPVVNSVDKQVPNYKFLLQQRINNIWHPPKMV